MAGAQTLMAGACGLIIGLVMGLTGAGGALVAIPLFIHILGMPLKEASVLSLLAVVIASSSNLWFQRKEADLRLGLFLLIFSGVGSFVASSWKSALPDTFLAGLLIAIAVYASYNMWRSMPLSSATHTHKPKLTQQALLSISVGTLLGILTTLTGLGGGVLMVPVLQRLYHYPASRAVATSLLAVSLSSMLSLFIQHFRGHPLTPDLSWTFLFAGIVLGAFAISKVLRQVSTDHVLLARKVVFSLVAALAVLTLL